MLYNYFISAIRNLRNRIGYTAINIFGLAIGLACAMVIISYVRLETSYDKFHKNHDRIYRITMDWQDDGSELSTAMVHAPLAEIITGKITGVESIVRVYPHFQSVYIGKSEIEKTKVDQFLFADSTFFRTFDFDVIKGSLNKALSDPFNVVLTRKMATQLFGTIDVVNKTLRFEDEEAEIYIFNIVAVVEDVPQNSHFHFGIVASFSTLKTVVPYYNNWYHPPLYTYLQLTPSTDPINVEKQVQKIVNDALTSISNNDRNQRIFHLQNIADIHLHSNLENEWEANSEYVFIQLFMILAGFILLIACINFTNLSTAQASQRAKEIGIRKVMGSLRSQLVIQFLTESLIITILAFGLALAISEIALLNIFNDIIDKELSLLFMLEGSNALVVLSIIIMVGLFSGLYPAFFLSRLKPIATLKGDLTGSAGKTVNLRRAMVGFQFFVTSVLMLATLTIMRQTNLMRNKKLGFDQEHIVSMKMVDRYSQKNYSILKDKLLSNSKVISAGLSATLPGGDGFYGWTVIPEGKEERITLKSLGVDEDFLKTYNIEVTEGRDFSKDILSDQTEAVILNRAAVKLFDWDNGLNKELKLTLYVDGPEVRNARVIGIVEDFHYQSLYHKVEPLVIYINKHPYYSDYLSVKFATGNLSESVDILQNAWEEFHPDKPLDYVFLDTALEELYHSEQKRSQIFSSFAILSIVISCLGLFGLSAYSIQQRTREVGIRKVLGASILNILRMLSAEYMMLIIAANIIAWPLVAYFANKWLSNFVYSIDLSIWMFIAVVIAAILISIITIGYQALKAATTNPVNTLRNE